jgi:predicted PurR-regulated permease PerM
MATKPPVDGSSSSGVEARSASASAIATARSSSPPLVGPAAFVIVIVGIYLASGIVSMLLLSVLVTILVAPIAGAARRRGWPGWAALTAALAAYVGVLAIVAVIAAVGLFRLLDELPSDTSQLGSQLGIDLGADAGARIADAVGSVATSLARSALSALAVIGYSVIIVAYLLLEVPRAPDRVRWAFGDRPEVAQRAGALALRLRAYLIARAVLGGIAAILDTALLLVLGIPSALLWGILSFLMSFVPNVGFIISMIPPAILALIVGGVPTAIAVVVGYSVINVAIDYLVQPRFIGGAVDLSPVVVTVSLLFWALVLGGAGAIFAVPLTIMVVGIADSFDSTRPLSRMLADAVPALATPPAGDTLEDALDDFGPTEADPAV